MAEPVNPMFFIVRTDVGGDSGLQRSFGAFDDEPTAARARDEIAAHMKGIFVVFEGVPKPDDKPPGAAE